MNKKSLFVKIAVFFIIFSLFNLNFCFAGKSLKKNDTSVFVKIEPVILGIYTNGNEIAVFLTCEESKYNLTKISGTVQFSNLTFLKASAGSMFDPKTTKSS